MSFPERAKDRRLEGPRRLTSQRQVRRGPGGLALLLPAHVCRREGVAGLVGEAFRDARVFPARFVELTSDSGQFVVSDAMTANPARRNGW